MKHFTLLILIVLGIFYTSRLQAQCSGALSLVLTGSSTGGNVSTTVTTSPQNTTTSIGATFTLSVVATGDNLMYQWYKNVNTSSAPSYSAITNATNSSYTVNSATATDITMYYAVVHSNCGTDQTSGIATVSTSTVNMSIKVFLEGPYTNGAMSANLGSYIPTTFGSQNTTSTIISNNSIVDWITIELRSSSSPSTVLYSRNALLKTTGDVVDVDGISPVSFSMAQASNYYVAVRHRNHLGFRSSSAIALNGSTPLIDFTTGNVTTYGTNALKYKSGAYVMYAGDANGDGSINAIDKNVLWLNQNGTNGYLGSDFNLSGFVNAIDKNNFWLLNNGITQQLD